MSLIATHGSAPWRNPPDALAAFHREGQRRQPMLWGFAVVLLALMAPTLAAYLIDARQLYGIDVWTKILKFEISLALFFGTIAWFWDALAVERRSGRVLKAFAYAALGAASLEMAYMIVQAGRGVASHFNESTPLEAALFPLMGLGALTISSLSAAMAVAIARNGRSDLAPAYRLAIVLGLALSFVLGVGAGVVIARNGGHWVSAPHTDAGAFPVFGWTRSGGDLRVAHFFGLHAMQFLPIAGWFLARRDPRATWPVWLAAVALTTLTAFTLWQALNGMPFLAFVG
ncbi:MAG: hypothetical protein ABI399_02135 [Bauldia sp.]